MSAEPKELYSLLIPLKSERLLVPRMCVAEVIAFTQFAPHEFYADRDKVFVLGSYAGTIKRNGRKVAAEWLMVFTLRDGKLAKFREFTDTYAAEEAYRSPPA